MYNRYIKVKDSNCLVRDRESGAIINIDRSTREKLLKRRENQQQLENRVSDLETQLNNVNNKLDTILNILATSRN